MQINRTGGLVGQSAAINNIDEHDILHDIFDILHLVFGMQGVIV